MRGVIFILLPLFFSGQCLAEAKVVFVKNVTRTNSPGIEFDTGACRYTVILCASDKTTTNPEALELTGIGLFPSKRGWSGIGNWLQFSAPTTFNRTCWSA